MKTPKRGDDGKFPDSKRLEPTPQPADLVDYLRKPAQRRAIFRRQEQLGNAKDIGKVMNEEFKNSLFNIRIEDPDAEK